MPRPRPRTRLHVLADAITALDKATACLEEIDLRSTNVALREDVKQSRELAAQAKKVAREAYLQAATTTLTPVG